MGQARWGGVRMYGLRTGIRKTRQDVSTKARTESR